MNRMLTVKEKINIAKDAIDEWIGEITLEDYKPICWYGSYNLNYITDCDNCDLYLECEEEQRLENPGDVWDYGDWE